MDVDSSRKNIAGSGLRRKRSTVASSSAADNRSQDAQFCNRIGCNGRLKYNKCSLFGFAGKSKCQGPSSCSSKGKEIDVRSSITPKTTNVPASLLVAQRKSSCLVTDLPVSSDVRFSPSSKKNQTGLQCKTKRAARDNATPTEVRTFDVASHRKSERASRQMHGSGCSNAVSASPASTSSSNILHNNGSGTWKEDKGSRHCLRNLPSSSVSEVIPIAGSTSKINTSKKHFIKDTTPGGGSSSSVTERRRNRFAKSKDGSLSSSSGVSLSSSRGTRNIPSSSDGSAGSTGSRRSFFPKTRMRLSNHDSLSVSSVAESSVILPQLQLDSSIEARGNRPSLESSAEAFLGIPVNSVSTHNAANTLVPFTYQDHGFSHALQQYNLNGIAEMIMSLERIEQDEELSYEQLVSLESNLFLGSFHWYDRHRDMRLDIDNMSYEELLELGERMGNVSTALPEEALSKCIRRSIYQISSAPVGFCSCNEKDDVKCSVCQEEFVVGEEIGKLVCEHRYHAVCIEQWLRLKNWCPICKASLAL